MSGYLNAEIQSHLLKSMIEINKKIKRQLTTLVKEKIDASGINNIIVNQNANKKKKQKGSNKSA